MIKKNFYWVFDKALSKATCQKIIKHGEARKLKMGSIENIGSEKRATKKERKYVEKFRKSQLCFINDKWLYDLFSPYINTANKNAGWGYDLTWSESFQYTVYKKNNFYHWHQDSFDAPFTSEDPNFDGKVRKISLICNLTDPKKFTGGEVEFDITNLARKKEVVLQCKELRKQGTIVIFPSYIWHRVKPIKSGTRKSIVNWSIGNPWR